MAVSVPVPTVDDDQRSISPLISADAISVSFAGNEGEISAIFDLSLDVRSGEFLVVVGPSGCGKTTLLRVLAGLQHASSGEITYPSTSAAPRNAMVFQGRSVFPWMSVADNISYGLRSMGMSKGQRKQAQAELLHLMGLEGFQNAWPHQLSEGMRQRVAIARALAVQPELLLMDEPFGSLDEQTRFLLQEELLRIWEQTRTTVLFVTHSIDEALTLADRVIVMTARPGTVKSELAVPLPRPRSIAEVRTNPDSAALFARIWSGLQEEVVRTRQMTERST